MMEMASRSSSPDTENDGNSTEEEEAHMECDEAQVAYVKPGTPGKARKRFPKPLRKTRFSRSDSHEKYGARSKVRPKKMDRGYARREGSPWPDVSSDRGRPWNKGNSQYSTTKKSPASQSYNRNRSKSPARFTSDGVPICLICGLAGHIARECSRNKKKRPAHLN